jgi:hypothetical protein
VILQSLSKKKLLRFIHVGKCGGSTIKKLLADSPLVACNYESVIQSHIHGVSLDTTCDYLICLRNPISRAISAFEWRKKLVISDPAPNQQNRFRGESNVLKAYSSFSDLTSKLYQEDDSLNELVARDFQLIHHLRESISFYLRPLLPVLTCSNVYGIICQETLSVDCEKLLGIAPKEIVERKNNLRQESPATLGNQAVANLKRYLHDDYLCIASLWSKSILSDRQFSSLMLGE